MVPWTHPSPHLKRHLDWFSLFATRWLYPTNTHTYTDRGTSVTIGMRAMRPKNDYMAACSKVQMVLGPLIRRKNSRICFTQQLLNCFVCVMQLVYRDVLRKVTRSSAIAEGPRDASCQLKSCQLPRNSAETTYTTSPDQIDGMKLEI